MVSAEAQDILGELSPRVFFGVILTGVAVMFALVASCWMV